MSRVEVWAGWRYRFEVTVDDLLLVEHLQAAQQSVGEASDQSHREALEVVLLDQLVQVDPGTHAGAVSGYRFTPGPAQGRVVGTG